MHLGALGGFSVRTGGHQFPRLLRRTEGPIPVHKHVIFCRNRRSPQNSIGRGEGERYRRRMLGICFSYFKRVKLQQSRHCTRHYAERGQNLKRLTRKCVKIQTTISKSEMLDVTVKSRQKSRGSREGRVNYIAIYDFKT